MKARSNTNWTPAIALAILMLIGVIGCTVDPVSSTRTDSAISETQLDQTTAGGGIADDPGLVLLTGTLRMDESGRCWYLIVHPSEIYELKTKLEIRGNFENDTVLVIGRVADDIPARCSAFPVLIAKKISVEASPEHP